MFSIEDIKNYCEGKHRSVPGQPFGPDALVFSVMDKMFALISLKRQPDQINLKCDPFVAHDLRERYPAILPGYHMNKRHWNTVLIGGSLDDELIRKLIDDSYMLVVNGLTRAQKAEWEKDE